MTTERPDAPPLDRDLRDHPGLLGDLADTFLRRHIAATIDTAGNVVFVRPSTVLVDCRDDVGRRDRIAGALAAFNAKPVQGLKAVIREPRSSPPPDGTVPPLDVVAIDLVGNKSVTVRGEQRWTIDAIRALRTSLLDRDTTLKSEYCVVVLASQNVKGNPVGARANYAGEVGFVADTARIDGRTVLLSSAEPATRPPFIRHRLNLPTEHRRPRVLVLDTGLCAGTDRNAPSAEHPDLHDSCRLDWRRLVLSERSDSDGSPLVDDEDETDEDSTDTLDFEAGHGTFIAGIVRQICPDADIYNAGVLSSFGDGDVFGVLDTLSRVLPEVGPVDVVIMSFGMFFPDDDPGLWGSLLLAYLGDAVGVAAAGNEGTCRPHFPAALPDVIGVGGLAADGKAWFTNFGGWVDACAPAVDVVSTFFTDFQETIDGADTRHYTGWARWSGTSFSAPKVAAVIAQEMYLNRVSAKDAWKRVTSHKHLRYPDLGVVFNV